MSMFRVDYAETVTYSEVIEANTPEEAYKEFYKIMEKNDVEPDFNEIENIEITEITQ